MSACAAEMCPNWTGDGDACVCALLGLERPTIEEPDTCPKCDGPADRNWFDRELCPPPCNTMHTRCRGCDAALDACPNEAGLCCRTPRPIRDAGEPDENVTECYACGSDMDADMLERLRYSPLSVHPEEKP